MDVEGENIESEGPEEEQDCIADRRWQMDECVDAYSNDGNAGECHTSPWRSLGSSQCRTSGSTACAQWSRQRTSQFANVGSAEAPCSWEGSSRPVV